MLLPAEPMIVSAASEPIKVTIAAPLLPTSPPLTSRPRATICALPIVESEKTKLDPFDRTMVTAETTNGCGYAKLIVSIPVSKSMIVS